MSKLKLFNGIIYTIADYATPNNFIIFLGSMTTPKVLETLTEESLSEIQFLTDNGEVTGTYRNKLLCGYVDNGDSLAVSINDADLCRYGLILDKDNRINSYTVQRYASEDAIIVDKLPEGNIADYQYLDGEFIYNPLPKEEIVETFSQLDLIEAQITYTAIMTNTLLEKEWGVTKE